MKLTLSEVYAPVGNCRECGAHLNLEATGWRDTVPEDIEARCIRCNHSERFGMSAIEKLVQERLGLQTWLCNAHSGQLKDGCLVVGERLFATTVEQEKLREAIDEEGGVGPAAERLRSIREQEELVVHYVAQGDFDAAYHHAAAKHDCGFKAGQQPLNCRDLVGWIYTSTEAFIADFFTVYGLVIVAWANLLKEIQGELHICDEDSVRITNETEVRQRFKELLDAHNRFGYEIIWGEDRPVSILIDGKTKSRKADLQLQKLVAVELKSFLRFQKYTAAGARKEVERAVEKLSDYEGVFGVAFLLCLSDTFPAAELYAGTPLDFPLPVRLSIDSFVRDR